MAKLELVQVDDRLLPLEDLRSRYVTGTDAEPTTVQDSAYYRRALARGDVREPVRTPTLKAKG
jgi:hypothetical protein